MYSTRSTSSDMTVALITPPITTVASGRCTSAPMPVLSAIGTKAEGGDQRGHQHRPQARHGGCLDGLLQAHALPTQLADVETSSMSSSTATPDRATKPIAAEIENGMSRIHRAIIPPVQANGTPVKTRIASMMLWYVKYSRPKIRAMRQRHDDHQSLAGADQVLELPAPFDVIAARRQFHFLVDASAVPRRQSCPCRGRECWTRW